MRILFQILLGIIFISAQAQNNVISSSIGNTESEFMYTQWKISNFSVDGSESEGTFAAAFSNVIYEENSEVSPSIYVYPNPCFDEVRISGSSDLINIEIYDSHSRLVKGKSIEKVESGYFMKLHGLQAGIYHLRVFNNDVNQNFKIIKR